MVGEGNRTVCVEGRQPLLLRPDTTDKRRGVRIICL
jgi:hypothetical protein